MAQRCVALPLSIWPANRWPISSRRGSYIPGISPILRAACTGAGCLAGRGPAVGVRVDIARVATGVGL
jgi:hypothetical protein